MTKTRLVKPLIVWRPVFIFSTGCSKPFYLNAIRHILVHFNATVYIGRVKVIDRFLKIKAKPITFLVNLNSEEAKKCHNFFLTN